MTLACARLGCTERAHTVLVFEPGSAAAWLMHAVEAHRTQGILLCRVHADGVTVPMGWNLVDERDPTWEPVQTRPASPDPEPVAQAVAPPAPTTEAEIVDIATLVASDDDAAAVASSDDVAAVASDDAVPAVRTGGTDAASTDHGDSESDLALDPPGAAPRSDDEAAFDEVVTAQWSDVAQADPDVATPTLFAVDDDDDEDAPVDAETTDTAVSEAAVSDPDAHDMGEPAKVETPLLNRAFRAAQRF